MTEQYWENLIDEIDTLKRSDAIARLKKIASDQVAACVLMANASITEWCKRYSIKNGEKRLSNRIIEAVRNAEIEVKK